MCMDAWGTCWEWMDMSFVCLAAWAEPCAGSTPAEHKAEKMAQWKEKQRSLMGVGEHSKNDGDNSC